jgi:hypothetical protein
VQLALCFREAQQACLDNSPRANKVTAAPARPVDARLTTTGIHRSTSLKLDRRYLNVINGGSTVSTGPVRLHFANDHPHDNLVVVRTRRRWLPQAFGSIKGVLSCS